MAKAIFLTQQSGPGPPLTGLCLPSSLTFSCTQEKLGNTVFPSHSLGKKKKTLKGNSGGGLWTPDMKNVSQNPSGSKCLNSSTCFS